MIEMVCHHKWPEQKFHGYSSEETREWKECYRCREKWWDGDPEPRVVLAYFEKLDG
jgi:hypothetical protein